MKRTGKEAKTKRELFRSTARLSELIFIHHSSFSNMHANENRLPVLNFTGLDFSFGNLSGVDKSCSSSRKKEE